MSVIINNIEHPEIEKLKESQEISSNAFRAYLQRQRDEIKIPTHEVFFDKSVNDLIYSFLLINSRADYYNKMNIILKEDFSYGEIAEAITAKGESVPSKSTISRNINELVKKGLVHKVNVRIDTSEKIYCGLAIRNLESYYVKIDVNIVSFIMKNCKKDSVKIYAYLLSREKFFCKTLGKHAYFTKKDIIMKCLRHSTDTCAGTRNHVGEILESFKELSLMELQNGFDKKGKSCINIQKIENVLVEKKQKKDWGNLELKCPLSPSFMTKKTNDNLYVYLLTKSVYVEAEKSDILGVDKKEKIRFLAKENLNCKEVIEKVESVKNKNKFIRDMERLKRENLIDQYFVFNNEDDNKTVIRIKEVDGAFCLIPKRTLEFMYNACSQNSIKIYIYLINKDEFYLKTYGVHYNFSITEILKDCLLLKNTSHTNDRTMVTDILKSLINNGLIVCSEKIIVNNAGLPYKKYEIIRTSKTTK